MKLARDLLKRAGGDRRVLFQTACGLAVAGGGPGDVAAACREEAFRVLDALVRAGWKNRVALETDPDLDVIRADPRFAALLAKLPK